MKKWIILILVVWLVIIGVSVINYEPEYETEYDNNYNSYDSYDGYGSYDSYDSYDSDVDYEYDPNDKYYSENDYNNDGQISDQEFQGAVEDFMNDYGYWFHVPNTDNRKNQDILSRYFEALRDKNKKELCKNYKHLSVNAGRRAITRIGSCKKDLWYSIINSLA